MLVCSFGAGNALNPLTSLPDGFLFGLDQNLSGEFLHYVEAVIGKLRIRKRKVFALPMLGIRRSYPQKRMQWLSR